ncbi:unnamed protein product [Bemisia tabaci]|uniref:Uncharacterized protein n=1 Tax=Bemisia tabaci TaxID=7038 RepID=A0A9P0AII5_BEMTA|nr:unnamed protein product [Bemisia tabaci]
MQKSLELAICKFEGGDITGVVNLKWMVDQIRRFQVLNSQIFATLNKYLKSNEHDSASVKHVRCFLPLFYPSLAAQAYYYRPENLQSQIVHSL